MTGDEGERGDEGDDSFLEPKKESFSSFPLFPSSFRPILHKKALSLIACLSHFESALFHPCFFSQALRSVYKELHADHETGAADNK